MWELREEQQRLCSSHGKLTRSEMRSTAWRAQCRRTVGTATAVIDVERD